MTREEWRFICISKTIGADVNAIHKVMADSVNKGGAPIAAVFDVRGGERLGINMGGFADVDSCIDMEKAKELGIPISRRFPGGAGPYLTGGSMGAGLCVRRDFIPTLDELSRKFVGEVLVNAYKKLGVDSVYRHIGDIETAREVKKIAGTDVFIDGDAISTEVYIGTGFPDFGLVSQVYKVPPEKFEDKKYKTPEARVSSLNAELGRELTFEEVAQAVKSACEEVFGVKLVDDELTEGEKELLEKFSQEALSDEWVYKVSSGRRFKEIPEGYSLGIFRYKARKLIEAHVLVNKEGKIDEVMISGDFINYPSEYIFDLEKSLKGVDAKDKGKIGEKVEEVYKRPEWQCPLVDAEHFTTAIVEAVKKAISG
jgi:lipoate-protein ligase A